MSLDDLERDFVRALASYWGEPNTAGIHDTTTAAARALVAALDADEPCEYAPGNSFCLAHQKVHRAAPSEPSPSVPEAQVHMIEHELTLILAHIIRVQEGATRDYNNIWIQQRAENALAHWKLERRAHEEMKRRVEKARAILGDRYAHDPKCDCPGCRVWAILEGRTTR